MADKETGGVAFPMPGWTDLNGNTTYPEFGMTLRDWFAGQALVGILSTETAVSEIMMQVLADGDTMHRRTARMAYDFSDAMIEALK